MIAVTAAVRNGRTRDRDMVAIVPPIGFLPHGVKGRVGLLDILSLVQASHRRVGVIAGSTVASLVAGGWSLIRRDTI